MSRENHNKYSVQTEWLLVLFGVLILPQDFPGNSSWDSSMESIRDFFRKFSRGSSWNSSRDFLENSFRKTVSTGISLHILGISRGILMVISYSIPSGVHGEIYGYIFWKKLRRNFWTPTIYEESSGDSLEDYEKSL